MSEKKRRDGIVDDVCKAVLDVFDEPVFKQNKQKDQQARGLLKAVCQLLDPTNLFLYANSEKTSKDMIVHCQQTIARLQDYSAMAVRRMELKNDISLISEKQISVYYNEEEPSFESKKQGKRSSMAGNDCSDDEMEVTSAKKPRRDKDNDVLKSDMSKLENKVDEEKTLYDASIEQLKEAQFSLTVAKERAKQELGVQPDLADHLEDATRYLTEFKSKIKQAQDHYNGKGRGQNQSCHTYSLACRGKLAEAILELETKYKIAQDVEELADYDFKDLQALRKDCEIPSE